MTERVLRLKAGRIAWREVEQEVVGVALDRNEYFAVTPSGAPLWSALAEGTTRASLVEGLTRRFGIEPDRAERDVDAFLASLAEWDLLEP